MGRFQVHLPNFKTSSQTWQMLVFGRPNIIVVPTKTKTSALVQQVVGCDVRVAKVIRIPEMDCTCLRLSAHESKQFPWDSSPLLKRQPPAISGNPFKTHFNGLAPETLNLVLPLWSSQKSKTSPSPDTK